MPRVIPFAGPDDDIHVVVFPWVGHVRQIFVRAVEITVLVVVAVEEIADLERAAEADEETDGIGMPEGNVGGMIRPRLAPQTPTRWVLASRRPKSATSCTITFS